MIKIFAIICYRNLTKNKLFIFINILGLSIALACCIIGYFCYEFNSEFDTIHKNAAHVYRVNSWREFQNQRTKFAHVPMGLGNVIADNSHDIEHVIRYSIFGDGYFKIGSDLFTTDLVYVDAPFFQVFTFYFIEGDGSLSDKTSLVISENLAKKYFGSEPALGKNIDKVLDNGKIKSFTISGIFRNPPSNSSFQREAYTNFYNLDFASTTDWNENNWNYRIALFVSIPDASRLSSIAFQMQQYKENNNNIRPDFIIADFELESFVGIAVRDDYNNVQGTYSRSGFPLALIAIIDAIGLFLLLIACFNLTNTSIAISSKRLKEIGIRKIMGSTRKDMIFQFIGETFILCSVAMLFGMFIATYILAPAFNNLWPDQIIGIDYFEEIEFWMFTLLTLLSTALLAGSYPAFYISRFQPIDILKGKLKLSGNNVIAYTLLTFQFTISLASLVCSVTFTNNSSFQRKFDLGFDKDGLVFTTVENQTAFEAYKNILSQNPDIISIAGSRDHVGNRKPKRPIKSGLMELETRIMYVGDEYFKTVGIELIEGRDFIRGSETDRKESVIITEETSRKFGWVKPIGKEVMYSDTIKLTVIGVVKDIYDNAFWRSLEPMIICYDKGKITNYIVAKTQASKAIEVNRFMEAKWKELFPDKMYEGKMIDNGLYEAIRVNNNLVSMSGFFGFIALLFSVTGLYTQVSLNINKKMKEFGVRKVLGASLVNLSWILNKQFVIILLLSCVAGGLMGTSLIEMLMTNIWSYHQEVTFVTLTYSMVLLIFVSLASISYKVYRTIRLNPTDILRDE